MWSKSKCFRCQLDLFKLAAATNDVVKIVVFSRQSIIEIFDPLDNC